MQLPLVPHTAKVTLNWRYLGKDVHNTLHYTNMNSGPPPTAAQLGPVIVGKLTADFRTCVMPTLALMSISAVPLDVPNAAGDEYATGLPWIGNNIGQGQPNNVAGVISLRTALRGRSFRGRVYQPGLAAQASNPNNVMTNDIGKIQAFWTSMLSLGPINGDAVALTIVSYWANKALRPQGIYTQVTSATVRTELGTQRRRMP